LEINKGQPSVYDYVFPVFGGEADINGNFEPKDIYGTAFYINNNFFVTCCHTMECATKNHGLIKLGYQNELGNLSFAEITDFESFNENDSAVLVAEIQSAKPYPWLTNKLAMLNDVISFGYPYGLDNENFEVLVRSFKGHIILVGFYNRFPKKPPHYELSYQCPRGLSGAPLVFLYQGKPYICGMTIGNEITDMIVSSFREVDSEGNNVSVYEKTESLHRGIALQTESLFKISSKLLNSTLEEYLEVNGLKV